MANTAFEAVGTWVKIETQTISGATASVDFTTGIDATYNYYVFVLSYVSVDSTAGTGRDIYMRTSTDGGATFDNGASAYQYNFIKLAAGGSNTGISDTTASFIQIADDVNGGSTASVSGLVKLFDPSNTTRNKVVEFQTSSIDSGADSQVNTGSGQRVSTGDIDAVRFLPSAGNFDEGQITLYGVL